MTHSFLSAALRSRAFDGYQLLEEEAETSAGKLHTLDMTGKLEEGVRVSSVSWSCTGATLAVAFEMTEHEDWCDHQMSLAVWNTSRRDFDPGSPQIVIQSTSCLTTVLFHPKEQALILAGGFSGELYIWSTTREGDPLMASSTMYGHR